MHGPGRHGGRPMGGPHGPGGHGGGPMGGHGGGPMGRPHRPMGGPPPRHHYGWNWGFRRPYRSGCLGGFLALILGCGGLFVFMLFAISSIF